MDCKFLLICFSLAIISYNSNVVHGQFRSLLNWQKDLEHRLSSYSAQRETIDEIIKSSIYPPRQAINGTVRVTSNENVRFSDLIIPRGALIFDGSAAKTSTAQRLVNKTENFARHKLGQMAQVDIKLSALRMSLDDPAARFIYKGRPNVPVPQFNVTTIPGTRVFKQFQYAHLIDARFTELRQINNTSVDRVIADTYMENPRQRLLDSEGRLFFDGRKTLWRSVFQRQLNSGCCDRLKPLHTSRMMRKSTNQEIRAPIMFQSSDPSNRQPVVIHNLAASQLHNRILTVGFMPNRPQDIGLVPSPVENFIQVNNLIHIKQPNQPEIFNTIIFKDAVLIDDAQVLFAPDNKLAINFVSPPNLRFDMDHSNYLLKYSNARNSTAEQRVGGRFIVDAETHFIQGIHAEVVNGIPRFDRFLAENVVRVDKPATIRGSVQFNALPAMMLPSSLSRPPQSIRILQVLGNLDVELLNGMRLPYDVVVLPPSPKALMPFEAIVVRGPRQFTGRLSFKDHVHVRHLVSGLTLPAGVIPLHLNDFMSSVGTSNIWFMDGITVNHMTVQGGQLDEILLKEVNTDAQSLIMRSAIMRQSDGSDLIRAPLRVQNLRLTGTGPDKGLLNGFRPQDVIELSRQRSDSVMGRKTFKGLVEAADCYFNDINQLANWTNHLIRIDRPNLVQTVYSKLAFVEPIVAQLPPVQIFALSSVAISNLDIEFLPNINPQNYLHNLHLSPELYTLHQALERLVTNRTGGRIRVLDRVELMNGGRINGISLDDIITSNQPFRFTDRFTMVGRVDVRDTLKADRITSSYPIDAMDIVQFDKYRVPIVGSKGPVKLNNLALSTNNRASFVQCHLLNGTPFSQFASNIMSLTRPQQVNVSLVFNTPVSLDGLVRTESSVNGVKNFRGFSKELNSVSYRFENGLQCNTVVINT